jgi:hypothetical protein
MLSIPGKSFSFSQTVSKSLRQTTTTTTLMLDHPRVPRFKSERCFPIMGILRMDDSRMRRDRMPGKSLEVVIPGPKSPERQQHCPTENGNVPSYKSKTRETQMIGLVLSGLGVGDDRFALSPSFAAISLPHRTSFLSHRLCHTSDHHL